MESTSYIIQGHFIGLQIFSDLLEQKGSATFIPVSALMVIRRFYSPSYTAQNFLSVSDTHPCREATGWVPLYPVKDFMVLFMPCQAPPNHRCCSAPPLCRATGHRGWQQPGLPSDRKERSSVVDINRRRLRQGGEGWYRCWLVPRARMTWPYDHSSRVKGRGRDRGELAQHNDGEGTREMACLSSALSELTLILGINVTAKPPNTTVTSLDIASSLICITQECRYYHYSHFPDKEIQV